MRRIEKPSPVTVACGILLHEGRVLVRRRHPEAHQGGKWEFPGGKVEPGETHEEALRREVREETGFTFQEAVLLHVEEHEYPDRTVHLHFYLCMGARLEAKPPQALEVRWVEGEELRSIEMPPANRRVIDIVAEQLSSS